MGTATLTLTAEADVISAANQLAAARKTRVSALFSSFAACLARPDPQGASSHCPEHPESHYEETKEVLSIVSPEEFLAIWPRMA